MAYILDSEAIVFDPSTVVLDDGQKAPALKLTGKRYTPSNPNWSAKDDGLILILTHGLGFHKEQWEPVLEVLFKTHNTDAKRPNISEAWSFDWQTHGDAGLINEKALQAREDTGVTLAEWGSAVAAFLKVKKFPRARTIGIGSSAGSTAIINCTTHFDIHAAPFAAIIVTECAIVTREVYTAHTDLHSIHFPKVIQALKGQRATWKNKEAVLKWLKSRPPFERWDPRVQDLYVKYALYKPREDSEELRVKCSKTQEAVTILDHESQFKAALQFGEFGRTKAVPIHFILGTHYDFVPGWLPENLFNEKDGRIPTSVTRMPDIGHYILQERPDDVAAIISDILSKESKSVSSGSSARL